MRAAVCRFLWYVLRERKFDEVAVTDLMTLRDRMRLNNEELAEAMYERCVRTERTYGNLMLQTEGAHSSSTPATALLMLT
jgi:hypothetical protein